MKTCVIVPVYNHEQAIPQVVEKLKVYGLPCLLINDGSSSLCSQVLVRLRLAGIGLDYPFKPPGEWRQRRGGYRGFKEAVRLGFTHAITNRCRWSARL